MEVPPDILQMHEDFQVPIQMLSEASANYLADMYRYYIAAVGAVDTGELIESVHIVDGSDSADDHLKYVRAGAGHAAVIEYGWTNRAKGQLSYPGRFPAQKAFESFIEKMDSGEIVDALNWRLGK
jgi:hypothetical protein